VNLPSITLGTENFKHKGYGVDESRVNSIAFEDITLTLFVDNSNKVLNLFQKWIDRTFAFSDGKETLYFPEEYWGTLDIQVKDASDNNVIKYTMEKAHPVLLGSVQLGWEQNDALARIPVTFTYRTYSTELLEGNQVSSQNETQFIESDFISV
jgi:hypothetical protein